MSNVERVQAMYAAFGRGDVQAILSALAPDVVWAVDGPANIAMFGNRRGRDQVAQFFQAIGANLDITEFAPREFFANGDQVVALGFERGTARATGRVYEGHWAHVFTFRAGQVIAFREYGNTAALADAWFGKARAA